MNSNQASELIRLIATGKLLSNIVSNLIKEGVRSDVCKDVLRQWDSQIRVCEEQINEIVTLSEGDE